MSFLTEKTEGYGKVGKGEVRTCQFLDKSDCSIFISCKTQLRFKFDYVIYIIDKRRRGQRGWIAQGHMHYTNLLKELEKYTLSINYKCPFLKKKTGFEFSLQHHTLGIGAK